MLFLSQDDICMHLTNYAINKHNQNFIQDDRTGSKRYSPGQVLQSLVHILHQAALGTLLTPSFWE